MLEFGHTAVTKPAVTTAYLYFSTSTSAEYVRPRREGKLYLRATVPE